MDEIGGILLLALITICLFIPSCQEHEEKMACIQATQPQPLCDKYKEEKKP